MPGWSRRVSIPSVPGAQTLRITLSGIIPRGIDPTLVLADHRYRPTSRPVPGWSALVYAVPARAVDGAAALIHADPANVPLNGALRLWYRVNLRTGLAAAFVGRQPAHLRYHVQASGTGTILLPSRSMLPPAVTVVLGARALPHYTVRSAELLWPAQSLPTKPWLPYIGWAWLAALGLAMAAARRGSAPWGGW